MRRRGKKFRHKTRRAVAALLPNLLTLGNAVCGFGAIVMIAGAASGWTEEQGLMAAFEDGKLRYACWLIFAAMVFDALDGSVARMTRQTSNLGAQLDSLSDAVTFAVAPAFLVWKIISLLPKDVIHIPQKMAWVLAVLYMVFGLLRLARFNIETASRDGRHEYFKGLPTPAAAAVIASLTWLAVDIFLDSGDKYAWVPKVFFLVIPVVTLFLGGLMVSRVPYPHVLNRLFRGRRSFAYLVQVIFILALLALIPYLSLAIALVLTLYVCSGLVVYLRTRVPEKKPAEAPVKIQETTK
ncbi:MAG: CDP-diacylglycerol--serine O-phosphatidyltransferase [Planctomycetota bacterium]|jgi:CDP-diacylglycerol--serine O-phosphatidyltransferase